MNTTRSLLQERPKAVGRSQIAVIPFFLVILSSASLARATDEELVKVLQSFDARVVPAAERESFANQVRDQQRQAMRNANDRCTAEWRQIKSRDDWERFRSDKLAALKKSLGAWPEPPKTVPVRVASTFEGDDFVIENILFESRPGWWVTANRYRPAKERDSMPGIIICHAHHTPKEHGELQDMGMTWARAGCVVLVMDQLGHGERRQHPFATAADFDKQFRVGHADYYFRYDSAIQLSLVGESLVGWMAWDMMRAADVLLAKKGVDPKRLILLGAVAGGGDPAAVTGALDERFAAVVPFNFGGPQPETRFPLPDDAELSFNYAGGGSWESTRNLCDSAAGGFLPWVIVGSVAPRKLVYAHEFKWDQDRDPVWKRFQTIFGFYEQPTGLSFTKGSGAVTGSSSNDTHCTHIGKTHRVRIHEAFRDWFGIDVTPETEFSSRIPADRLRCWTPDLKHELRPKTLAEITTALADEFAQRNHRRQERQGLSGDRLYRDLRRRWSYLLQPATEERLLKEDVVRQETIANLRAVSVLLTSSTNIRIPILLLKPAELNDRQPVVVAICSQGKERLLKERSRDVAELLEHGAAVCLIDPRGIGESKLGDSHGRRSSATSISSTALMLGTPLLGQQLRDVRIAMSWLRDQRDFQGHPFAIWGESLTPPNPDTARFRQPRDDDASLPAPSEPQAPLLALFAGLFEDDVSAIYTSGGLISWRTLLTDSLVLTAHDSLVPGTRTICEIYELSEPYRPDRHIRNEAAVDGWNRLAHDTPKREGPAKWLINP
jgi:cephalosporin-C deacetylase-like acetyl esterase